MLKMLRTLPSLSKWMARIARVSVLGSKSTANYSTLEMWYKESAPKVARVDGSQSRACTGRSRASVPTLMEASPTGSRKYPRWFVTGTQPASASIASQEPDAASKTPRT